jgi:hypothetical protein
MVNLFPTSDTENVWAYQSSGMTNLKNIASMALNIFGIFRISARPDATPDSAAHLC